MSRSVKVYAYAADLPAGNYFCPDFRRDNFDAIIRFSSLRGLVDSLNTGFAAGDQDIRRGEISRLAMACHGYPGIAWVDGQVDFTTPEEAWRRGLSAYSAQRRHGLFYESLRQLGLYTRAGSSGVEPSVILLLSCFTGRSQLGTLLLAVLSRIWPGRKVVGFTTPVMPENLVESDDAENPFCIPPGEDLSTPYSSTLEADRYGYRGFNGNPLVPADENSPYAKVAQDGCIIKWGLELNCAPNQNPYVQPRQYCPSVPPQGSRVTPSSLEGFQSRFAARNPSSMRSARPMGLRTPRV